MKTLQEWVNFFNTKAYIFNNGFTGKSQFFIPICEHTEVVIDPSFDVFSYSKVINNGEIVCDIKDLIKAPFLTGNDKIFIVPIEFDDDSLPEENVIEPVKKS